MKKILLVTLLLFWASFAVAQRGGIPTFTASDNFEYDTINLTTLTPVVHFPLLSKGGGGSSIAVESPQSCHITGTSMYCGYLTNLLPGLFFVPHELVDLVAVGIISLGSCNSFSATGFMGLDGLTVHPISSVVVYQNSGCGVTSVTATTIDGSGITATFGYPNVQGVSPVSSAQTASGWTWPNSASKIEDPFGNTITWGGLGGSLTDFLGAATTLGNGTQGFGSPSSYGYTDAGGSSRTISLVAGTATTFQPIGNCPLIANGGTAVTPYSSISFPDSTSIGITWDTNNGGIDGMIKSFTTREGGTITYTYGTVTCAGWYFNTLSRQTPDGTTSYSASYASGITTTTVKDPGLNKTVYTFFTTGSPAAPSQTSTIDRYQNTGTVASPTYTHISETQYCYNTHSCSTAPTYPITQLDTYQYTYKPDGTQVAMSHDVKTYDSTYGLLLTDAATDSITSQTITTTYMYGTYSSGSCSAITNTAIHDHPCTITTKNGSTWLSESTYSYNSNGALTSSSACLSSTCTGSSALTTAYTPTTQGTYSAIQDPNGQTVNYTYGSCNSLMPTDVTTTVNTIAIDHKATWNCDAGVVTDTTDPNSNEADYTYDSMDRLHTYHDYMGDTNTTTYDYGTPTLDHVKVTDNLGVVSYQYVDGLGRSLISQIYNGTNYDTVSHAYGWTDSMSHALTNFQATTSAACKTTLDATCSTVAMTSLVNPIAGPYTNTDANNGVSTFAVNSKDFSVTASPHPTNENNKVVDTEVDGFGRTTSVCALLTSGGSSCGQTMSGSGILTSNTYSFPSAGVSEVQTTRGSQTHTTKADAVGRTTSIQTPEGGTVTYSYDSVTTTNCGTQTSAGALLEVSKSGSSLYNCYLVDGLQRLTDVGNNGSSFTTSPCKRFRYDSTANNAYTKPTGYPSSGANLIGRLMEASTDDCTSPLSQAHMITDEWFAYDAMGRMTDMWETTPNSSGFYHTTATYDADGNVTALSSSPTNFPSFTFGMDSEGRPFNSQAGTTWIVGSSSTTGVSYDAASMPLTIPIGSGGGSDTYTYDSLEQMKTYTFAGNSKSMGGTITWNSIGSLGTLAITDTFNSGGAQTCNYLYDDVGRLGVPPNSPTPPNAMGTKSVDCSTVFNAEYGYDQYDNMETAGSYSWTPGYSSTNNEQTGSTYDSDGNVTNDTVNRYTWDAYGKLASENPGSSNAVCGTSGSCLTYDAVGNIVERNNSGSYQQFLYGPTGLLGQMTGSSISLLNIPQPGGGEYMSFNSINYYLHSDWLGTKRLATKVSDGSQLWDTAYSPYARDYNTFGTLEVKEFAGTKEYTISTLYDTPNRELFKNASRWLSPDPAHSGWNAYAYVTDPNTQTDPSGLYSCSGSTSDCSEFNQSLSDNSRQPCPAYGVEGCPQSGKLATMDDPTQLGNDVKGNANLAAHEEAGIVGLEHHPASVNDPLNPHNTDIIGFVAGVTALANYNYIMNSVGPNDELTINQRVALYKIMRISDEASAARNARSLATDYRVGNRYEDEAQEMVMRRALNDAGDTISVEDAIAAGGRIQATRNAISILGTTVGVGTMVVGNPTTMGNATRTFALQHQSMAAHYSGMNYSATPVRTFQQQLLDNMANWFWSYVR